MAERTARRARQHCLQHIATIQGRLLAMARHWGDIDEEMVRRLTELEDEVAGLAAEMDEAVQYADDCKRERET